MGFYKGDKMKVKLCYVKIRILFYVFIYAFIDVFICYVFIMYLFACIYMNDHVYYAILLCNFYLLVKFYIFT